MLSRQTRRACFVPARQVVGHPPSGPGWRGAIGCSGEALKALVLCIGRHLALIQEPGEGLSKLAAVVPRQNDSSAPARLQWVALQQAGNSLRVLLGQLPRLPAVWAEGEASAVLQPLLQLGSNVEGLLAPWSMTEVRVVSCLRVSTHNPKQTLCSLFFLSTPRPAPSYRALPSSVFPSSVPCVAPFSSAIDSARDCLSFQPATVGARKPLTSESAL